MPVRDSIAANNNTINLTKATSRLWYPEIDLNFKISFKKKGPF